MFECPDSKLDKEYIRMLNQATFSKVLWGIRKVSFPGWSSVANPLPGEARGPVDNLGLPSRSDTSGVKSFSESQINDLHESSASFPETSIITRNDFTLFRIEL